MYLTRLRLDPRSAQVRRDLANPYDMHRTLVRAFVADETATPPRFLWRIEPSADWAMPVVLVQSDHAGDWSIFSKLPNYLKQWVETKFVDLEALLQKGSRYRFRLIANPTVKKDGKRHGLASEKAQLDWLARQGRKYGFMLVGVLVAGSHIIKGQKDRQSPIHLQQVHYEGLLQLENAATLNQAISTGIGPGKSFGCGLLSVARTS
ncbi:MAG: type I-E CRISPR-associated protein Cas6/Cse3/CasE [Desulfovibrio sp.]|jgi:CRISPR system Cascade subunit CasE|nr:type I-E CRISPR-associated protein Cas6/Cse3/CasE [Desulfovibrio sp.]